MELGDDLYQAILDDPDDDDRRLVYADYLEERGDPRSEFIRVQCELERLPLLDPRRGPLRSRSAQLLALHGAKWAGIFRGWSRFRRGFIEHVEADGRMTIADLERFFRLAPIQSLKITFPNPPLRPLLASPVVPGRLRSLDLNGSGALGDKGSRMIASCAALAGLRRLSMGACNISAAGASAIAGSPHLASLTFLNLNDNGRYRAIGAALMDLSMSIGDRGAEALAASEHLGKLQWLYLRNCSIGDAGARALADSTRLSSLNVLLLDSNYVMGQELRRELAARRSPTIIVGTMPPEPTSP